MNDKELLEELFTSENEEAALKVLVQRGLLIDGKRWRALGNMPNNQAIVLAQQSTSAAALVEKFTNGLDAILLRHCKAKKIVPRGPKSPRNMAKAVYEFFGELNEKNTQEVRILAEENLVLYATGSKVRGRTLHRTGNRRALPSLDPLGIAASPDRGMARA
jgi:hypothetical protein